MVAPRTALSLVLQVAVGAAFVAYPALVWFGLTRWSPRVLALVMLAVLVPLAVVRLRRADRAAVRQVMAVPAVTICALLVAALVDAKGGVLVVPVAINAVLLAGFGATLRSGSVPMIERFARLQEPDLSPAQRAWCRQWTRIWCAFFVFNGAVALVLALAAPLSWWAVYNGFIAYVLIGLLLAGEWIVRRRKFARRAT